LAGGGLESDAFQVQQISLLFRHFVRRPVKDAVHSLKMDHWGRIHVKSRGRMGITLIAALVLGGCGANSIWLQNYKQGGQS
jgi:hypothetical protein